MKCYRCGSWLTTMDAPGLCCACKNTHACSPAPQTLPHDQVAAMIDEAKRPLLARIAELEAALQATLDSLTN